MAISNQPDLHDLTRQIMEQPTRCCSEAIDCNRVGDAKVSG